MLKIDKKDEEIIVIFDPVNAVIIRISFFLIFFLGVNIFIYLKTDLENLKIDLKYSILAYFIVIIFILLLYEKIEIIFKKEGIKVYKYFYGIKKLKIYLKYKKIKNMEKIFMDGRRGHQLRINDLSNLNYPIVKGTTLEKELDEIIRIYENDVKEMLDRIALKDKLEKSIQEATLIYNLTLKNRYQEILKKIIEEEKFYISQIEERLMINGSKIAIENLEIFKNMEWEEVNFYIFYVNFLSKKENADKVVEVAYNGEDSKKVKVSELREDINRIRYPQDYKN